MPKLRQMLMTNLKGTLMWCITLSATGNLTSITLVRHLGNTTFKHYFKPWYV